MKLIMIYASFFLFLFASKSAFAVSLECSGGKDARSFVITLTGNECTAATKLTKKRNFDETITYDKCVVSPDNVDVKMKITRIISLGGQVAFYYHRHEFKIDRTDGSYSGQFSARSEDERGENWQPINGTCNKRTGSAF